MNEYETDEEASTESSNVVGESFEETLITATVVAVVLIILLTIVIVICILRKTPPKPNQVGGRSNNLKERAKVIYHKYYYKYYHKYYYKYYYKGYLPQILLQILPQILPQILLQILLQRLSTTNIGTSRIRMHQKGLSMICLKVHWKRKDQSMTRRQQRRSL